jgi:hypothetical protein
MSLPSFPAFELTQDGNIGPRWDKWLARLTRLLVGMDVKDANRCQAPLLHYAGPDVDEIYDTLTIAAPGGDETVFDAFTKALTSYFKPRTNTAFEVYTFRQCIYRYVRHTTLEASKVMWIRWYREGNQQPDYPSILLSSLTSTRLTPRSKTWCFNHSSSSSRAEWPTSRKSGIAKKVVHGRGQHRGHGGHHNRHRSKSRHRQESN